MDENTNTNANIEQQPTTPTPEASGDQGEKLFSQADLDRIIGERLARERAKAEPSESDVREANLRAREARLSCREYLEGEGFPTALMDILDTSDADKFKAAVEALDQIVYLPSPKRRPAPRFGTRPVGGGSGRGATDAMIGAAFAPPKI